MTGGGARKVKKVREKGTEKRENGRWGGRKGKLDNKRGKKWGKESKKLRSKKREEKGGGDHHSEDTTVSLGHWVIAAGTMAVTSLAPATAGEDKEHALMALKKILPRLDIPACRAHRRACQRPLETTSIQAVSRKPKPE